MTQRNEPQLLNQTNIQRLAMNAIMPGLEMSVQHHLELLNQARKALGLAPMKLADDDDYVAPSIHEAPLLEAAAPRRRGRPPGGQQAQDIQAAYQPPQQGASTRVVAQDAALLLKIKGLRKLFWSVKRISEEIGVSEYKTRMLVQKVDSSTESSLEAAANAPAPIRSHAVTGDERRDRDYRMDAPKVQQLRKEGYTYAEIARKMGISIATAGRWAKLAGPIPTPTNSAGETVGYVALASHTAYRWKTVREAGLADRTNGKLPTNELLKEAERILEERKKR